MKSAPRLVAITMAAGITIGVGASPAQAQQIPEYKPLTLAEVEADDSIQLVSIENSSRTNSHGVDIELVRTQEYTQSVYADPDRILCSYPGGIVRTYDWSNRNPQECGGIFRVYSNNELVFQHLSTNGPGLWGVINEGWAAVEAWCDPRPTLCSIVTSIGVLIVARQLRI